MFPSSYPLASIHVSLVLVSIVKKAILLRQYVQRSPKRSSFFYFLIFNSFRLQKSCKNNGKMTRGKGRED